MGIELYSAFSSGKTYLRSIYWQMFLVVAISSVCLTANAASSLNRKAVVEIIKGIEAIYDGERVSVYINELSDEKDPGLMIGDELQYHISSIEPKHYLLILVDPKANVSVVFPDYLLDSKVSKYQTFTYPPPGTGSLEQGEPAGIETVFVFATETRVGKDSFGLTDDSDFHTLGGDQESILNFVNLANKILDEDETDAVVYQYFVDSDVQFATRAVRRELKKRVQQVNLLATNDDVQSETSAEESTVLNSDSNRTPGIVEKSEALAVNDIRFEINSDELTSIGRTQLDIFGSELLDIWDTSPNLIVTLEGHTDDRGTEDFNQALSERRAISAKQYLVREIGLPESGIHARGIGETRPFTKNVDSESRALNRRVEIRLGRGG